MLNLVLFTVLIASSQEFSNIRIVHADKIEHKIINNAWSKATISLATLGFSIGNPPTVILEENPSINEIGTHGYYDSDKHDIHFTKLSSKRTAYGLSWNQELMESFLIHEFTHSILVSVMGEKESKIQISWHEAMAYYIQFMNMPAPLRESILKNLNYPKPYTSALSINDINYSIDPDSFSISASYFFENYPDKSYIMKITELKVAEATKELFF